jgi:hypothetical protein
MKSSGMIRMTADFKRFCYFRIQQTLTGMVPGAYLLNLEVNIMLNVLPVFPVVCTKIKLIYFRKLYYGGYK